MRILVSADIHLGSPIRSAALRNPELGERLQQASRDTFADVIDLAIAEKVDVLALAGDIFDNDQPDLKSRAFLVAQLMRAASAGVPTVLIRGNHDALLDHHAQGDLGPMLHLLHKDAPTVEISGVFFHGLSFETTHINQSLLPAYPPAVPGRKNVGLMHTSLDGSPSHDVYAPCSEVDLMAHGYDLWCLGHIHAGFERIAGPTLAVMPGIPQPRHFGERAGGTVTIVDLGAGTPTSKKHRVGHLAFAKCEIDLTECSDQQEVWKLLCDALLATQQSKAYTAVRLQVITDRYPTEEIESLAQEVLSDNDRVFLDKVKSVPPKMALDGKTDDLVRLMQDERDEPGFRLACKQVLDEYRAVLPSSISDELAETALDALVEEAIADVLISLHAGGPR